jgi:7 transmembrane sweet-taste receptor of 3 GCPR
VLTDSLCCVHVPPVAHAVPHSLVSTSGIAATDVNADMTARTNSLATAHTACSYINTICCVLTGRFAVAHPESRKSVSQSGHATLHYAECSSKYAVFSTMLWVYQCILIVAAAVLAFKTWNLADTVAEAKPIAVSTTLLSSTCLCVVVSELWQCGCVESIVKCYCTVS